MSRDDVVVRTGVDATGFVAGVEAAAAEVEAIRAEQAREDAALGAAWRRCEAKVGASGRSFLRLTVHPNNYDVHGGAIPPRPWYYAACNWVPGELGEDGGGSTPTAALEALAEKLEGMK